MRRIGRPSPALVVAMAALLVSLSGIAVALPGKNTVDSGDVINNTLKSADLKNGKVKTKDIKDNHIGARDFAGTTLRTGNNATAADAGVGGNDLWAKATSTATCEPGEQIIGGFGEFTSDTLLFDAVATEETRINVETNSVTAVGVADSGENETYRATAICLAP